MSIYRNAQGQLSCPACSCTRIKQEPNPRRTLYTCTKCHALFAEGLYLGESYEIVKPFLVDEEPGDQIRYFDFTCLGSRGIVRRHGWYRPADGMLVQVG